MKANSKRKVFGDAVDLLMGDMEEVTMPRGVQMVPVKNIHPFHAHPFHLYEGERLEDMIASVKEHGVLNPVIVQKLGTGYEMLSGHNIWNAAKLAGLKECGVCCEIMEDDGTMMRTPNLWKLAEKYNLKFITINDLQNYIRIHVKHVEKMAEAKLPTKYGEYRIAGYVNDITKEHHVALIKGDIGDGENVLCRVHSECLTGDVFGSSRCDCGEQLESAIKQIEKEAGEMLSPLIRRASGA